MAIKPTPFIWHNGKLVAWQDATVHAMAHGLHYGSSVFEGIRAYETPAGPAVFRLSTHIRRMFDSARIYGIEIPFSRETIEAACREVISANKLGSAYIRPIAYRGFGSFSLAPGIQTSIEVSIGAIEWGAYLGKSALEDGVDICVSSWTRPAPNTLPLLAKAAGHYLSSQLIANEAARNGYAEGIALDVSGLLSEGSGENLFIVHDGVLYTPPVSASILQGVTRDTVLTLSDHLNIPVREQPMPREMLYVADEIFLTGTAAEITPVRSVDRATVGTGKPGPITRALQDAFFGLFSGKTRDRWGWLDPVTEISRPEADQAEDGVAA